MTGTSGATLKRMLANSGWNLLGQGVGLLVALASIPIILKNLGAGGFGLFSIFLALVGYSGLLDLGIGRAITAEVARHSLRRDQTSVNECINTGTVLLALLGILLSVLIIALGSTIGRLIAGDGQHYYTESLQSLKALALAVPLVLVASAMRGALEGVQEFKTLSKINMPMGALMFAVPAAISTLSPSVTYLMWSLVAVRAIALAILCITCGRCIPNLRPRMPTTREAGMLVKAGSWMTISNAISPLMNNLDRAFIGANLSPELITLYVAPYELATKSLIAAGSIANATFPELAAQSTNSTRRNTRRRYFWRATYITTTAALLPSIILFVFSGEILSYWISADFAKGISTDILRLLSLGVTLNGAAYIPFAFLQSCGRSDITAKCHLFELAIFIPTLFYALSEFGIFGAAVAWVGRVAIDTMLLFFFSLKKLN